MYADGLGSYWDIAAACRRDHLVAHHANHAGGCMRRIDGIVNAAENQIAIAVIFEIGVKLGNHGDPLFPLGGLVRGECHAEYRNVEHARGIGYRAGNGFIAGSHAVERSMRF